MITNILCYGDSNTYGYIPGTGGRYPRDVRYPGKLQMLLGDEYNVIEEGCSGRTCEIGGGTMPCYPKYNVRTCRDDKYETEFKFCIIMIGQTD